MSLLSFIVIGAIAGWLAGQFMRGHGFGLIGDIVVGIIGAVIGAYLFRATGAELGGGPAGSLIVAFAGALVLLFVVRFFTGRRSGRRLWL
jgi:uncharacterized membrane protein YeaQ/YmgE (transglycosylase-associated protein family)